MIHMNQDSQFIIETERSFDQDTYNLWMELWEKADNAIFYNSPMWFQIHIATFHPQQFLIVKYFFKNKLIAIVPLVQSTKYFITVWETLLSSSPILILDQNMFDFEALKTYLKTLGTVIIAELTEDTISQYNSIHKQEPFSYTYTSERPFINISELMPKLSKKSFKRIRTKLRGTESILGYELRIPKIQDINTMARIELASFKKIEAKGIFTQSKVKLLYNNIVKLAGNNAVVGYLKDKNKNIEVISDFYLIGKNTAHATYTSYDKEYAKYWPGNLLQYKIIEDMYKMGIGEIDLGRGTNTLKLKFSTDVRKYYSFFISDSFVKRLWIFLVITNMIKVQKLKEKHSSLLTMVMYIRLLLQKLNFEI